MALAKTMAIGAAVFAIAAGSALAAEGDSAMEPDTVILLEPADMDVATYDVYGIDEDRDGVIDGYLFIEESDTLG